jgi:ABC-type glycerol-3-phosphate transport system substrate-binding protein
MNGIKGSHLISRRAVAGALVASPALLAACGGSTQGAQPAAAKLPPATIEYLHWAAAGGGQAQAREESARKFMATMPGVTVNVSAVAPSGTMLEKFKTTAAAGTPPDLLTLNTTWYGDLIASRMIASLDPLIKTRGQGFSRDAFYPDAMEVLSADGKLYGVPRFIVTSLFFYNKDLFTKLGIGTPAADWTWEKEWTAAAQKLTRTVGADQAFATSYAQDDLRNSLVYAWGGDLFEKTGKKALVDQPKALAALEFAHGLRFKSRLMSTPDVEKVTNAQQLFLTERTGFYPSQNFAYGTLKDASFKIGAVLLPKGPGGRRQYGSTTAYGIAEGSKQQEAAWEFLKWLVGEAGQQHLVNTESITPATKKAYQSPDVPADVWNVFVEANKTAVYFPSPRRFAEAYTALNGELNQALVDDKRSVRDSANAAAAAANVVLSQA